MATLYENQVVWTYGTYNSTLQLSLYYTKSRSGTTQYYSFSGTMKAVPPSGGSTYFGYNIKVYINVNGDIHTVYDKTISTSNWSSALDNQLDFSVANKTSGTTPFVVQVVSSAVGLDWSGSANLPIDPYVVAPTYNSISSSNISSSGVTLTASINNGGASITSGGWQLSTDGGSNWTTYSGDWGSKTITGLSRNTAYTYRGYATNSAGTTYSSTSTFTTLAEVPTVALSRVSSSASLVTYKVTLQDNGGRSGLTLYVYFSHNPDVLNNIEQTRTRSDSGGNVSFNWSDPATTYYAIAAAGDPGDPLRGYSSVVSWTSPVKEPYVSNYVVSDITDSSVTLSGTKVHRGGTGWTTPEGFELSLTGKVSSVGDIIEYGDVEQGITITGLTPNTKYWYRGFCTDSAGTGAYRWSWSAANTFYTLQSPSNVKVSINGASYLISKVKVSQNGGAFVTIPGAKVKTSINGGSF